MGEAQRPWQRRAVRIAVAVAGAAALWPLVAVLFSSDRGIGFRDEGLYLLAADPPTPTARWVTPFGWHTAPFFGLVGHDIARFRTLAVWMLVLTGGLFGWSVGRFITGAESTHSGTPGNARFVRFACTSIGALGGPLLTSGLLRTPGYNWVNLIGLMLAATGTLLAANLDARASTWRSTAAHVAAATVALGVVFTVPAKPSSAPLFALTAAVFLGFQLRRRLAAFAGLAAAWATGWTALALVARIWPVSFLRVLASSATFPPLDRNQTIPGALRDALRQPRVAWHDLTLLRPATVALMLLAAVLALVAQRSANASLWLRYAPFVLASVAAVGSAVPWPLLGLPNPAVRFDWYGTTNAGVLLFVGALLHLVAHSRTIEWPSVRRALGAAAVLVAVVFIFGFGSAMSIYHQAALAASVMWCAAALMVGASGRQPRTMALAALVLAAATLLTSNLVDSRHHPFDSTDVALQTTKVALGSGSVLLDEPTASFVTRLQSSAAAAGFCAGDRLIGVVWDWTSTTAVALQATVPEHLVLTIYGYPLQADVLDVTIHDLASPEWRNAWVLTSDPTKLTSARATVLRAALDRLPSAIQRTFPTDYTLVADTDGTQLWRPSDVTPAPCG